LEQELEEKGDITGENGISSDLSQYWTPPVGAFASGTQKEYPKRGSKKGIKKEIQKGDPKGDPKEDPKKGPNIDPLILGRHPIVSGFQSSADLNRQRHRLEALRYIIRTPPPIQY
jgi:hypothetical protein